MPTLPFRTKKGRTSSSIWVNGLLFVDSIILTVLTLERTLGGLEVFIPYARDYVQTYIGKSISYEDWKAHLYSYFQAHDRAKVKLLDGVDWNVNFVLLSNLEPELIAYTQQAWFFGEGLELPVKLQYDTTLANQAFEVRTDMALVDNR